ncbi:MAG: zinc-ribbon domain-containing protein, partial [Ruminococcus sp.]|nr:zinc-ribbon domain-containing protein [Ruminococcus sp.]
GAPASAVITFVCMMLAFLVGAAGNVIEAMIALKFKKLDAIPQAPYGSPYDSPYAYPSAAPQTQHTVAFSYAPMPTAPQTTQYCPSCGNPAPAESIFCEKCGQRLK